ncbi:MAG: hypothetical protein QG649_765, partial [Patescibacteria group bacterium]|nr:hypothetical protein [Patescibacteria group bacterium]
VTTNDINGAEINYVGGTGAIEAAGMRVDYTPGDTSGSQWSGVRIVASATGAASGVSANGIKLEGPTSAGTGTDPAVDIGTGWDIGIDIQSGGLQLAVESDPAAAAAGNLKIYAKDIAGRVMPKWIGPSGIDTPFQASLAFNRVAMVSPGGGTTITALGTAFTNVGTVSHPAPASTNYMTSVRRSVLTMANTAGSLASHRQQTLQAWRGNAAGKGGFFFTTRFGTPTTGTGNRVFVGLNDLTTAPTNVDPLTSTANSKIGMAINANTGNWSVIHNVAGTAPTQIALGSNFPINTTDMYELVLYSPPNGSTIGWRVTNKATNNSTSGSISTNMPATTTFLAPQMWMTNNATTGQRALATAGWYLESDD